MRGQGILSPLFLFFLDIMFILTYRKTMKRYVLFGVGFAVFGFLIYYGLKLKDFQEVLMNAALLCLSCIGIAN